MHSKHFLAATHQGPVQRRRELRCCCLQPCGMCVVTYAAVQRMAWCSAVCDRCQGEPAHTGMAQCNGLAPENTRTTHLNRECSKARNRRISRLQASTAVPCPNKQARAVLSADRVCGCGRVFFNPRHRPLAHGRCPRVFCPHAHLILVGSGQRRVGAQDHLGSTMLSKVNLARARRDGNYSIYNNVAEARA